MCLQNNSLTILVARHALTLIHVQLCTYCACAGHFRTVPLVKNTVSDRNLELGTYTVPLKGKLNVSTQNSILDPQSFQEY